MAPDPQTDSSGTVVQSWVPTKLAKELKQHARRERRSVSSTIRIALEDQLRDRKASSG